MDTGPGSSRGRSEGLGLGSKWKVEQRGLHSLRAGWQSGRSHGGQPEVRSGHGLLLGRGPELTGPEVYQWDSGHKSQVEHRRNIRAVMVNSEDHLRELRAGRRSAAPASGHSGLSRQRPSVHVP